MGGAREDDNAMRWFLKQADGGDILVLRTSGSNGYNDYLYSELQVNVNSVESIVVKNKNAVMISVSMIKSTMQRRSGLPVATSGII